MGTPSLLIEGVSILGDRPTDILVRDGVIAGIGSPPAGTRGATRIPAHGLVALPGLVDLHAHLREPGREDAETVLSGARAAALGGFTAVCTMANTNPVADNAAVVEQIWKLGQAVRLVDVQPVGAVTAGIAGERLAEMGAMAESAAAVRMFSDDGNCVADSRLMRRALEYVKGLDGVIAQHAEDPRLTEGAQMHEGVVSAKLGLKGWPAVAEESIIARDVLLAEHVEARLHILHVSTAGSVDIIRRAKARGVEVTAEVTPHHLLLTHDYAESFDPTFKVNPPLRTQEDVQALREAVIDGTIDVIATDHAPHTAEDKDCEWASAWPGMVGLETALSVVIETLLDEIGWEGIAERMSRKPARIARLDGQGCGLGVGAPANIVLVDPAARWVVRPDELATMSRNTPFRGMTLPGKVVATFLRGQPTVLNGEVVA